MADGERHPSVRAVYRWFSYDHLRSGSRGRTASMHCATLAAKMVGGLPDSPELTAGLRLLLQAKDCFVRASIEADELEEAQKAEAGDG